jgi:hypothetical protein
LCRGCCSAQAYHLLAADGLAREKLRARSCVRGCVKLHAQYVQHVTVPAAGGCGCRDERCAVCMACPATPDPASCVDCHTVSWVRSQPHVARLMHKGATFTLHCPARCRHSCYFVPARMVLGCPALSCTQQAHLLLGPSTHVTAVLHCDAL